jgi:hypothetical protein
MTKFENNLFDLHAGYLSYDGKFVARFRYSRAPITPAQFKRELIKNYSVEEYFGAVTELWGAESPLGFLEKRSPVWYLTTMNKWRLKNGLVTK